MFGFIEYLLINLSFISGCDAQESTFEIAGSVFPYIPFHHASLGQFLDGWGSYGTDPGYLGPRLLDF